MKKVFVAMFFFISIFSFSIVAQSAEKVSEMLSTEKTTVSQAAYFAATWLGLIDDHASGEEALSKLYSSEIWTANVNLEDPITLQQLSGLCLKTWKLSGGLLYSLTKSDRYAFKELQAMDFLTRKDDPSSFVSGHKALDIFMRCEEISNEGAE